MKISLASASSRAGHRSGGVKGPLAAGAEVRLVLPSYKPGERPKGEALPSLAVLGRSNVGKSTLLNALLGTKVARVSQTPGRTQALFWYRVGEKFDVVDCPGYGFAKTSKEKRESFEGMIETLLVGAAECAPVSAALLLVDSRLEPQASDLSMAMFLRESLVRTVVAATKWDAVKPSQRVRQFRALAAALEAPDRPLLPVSAETGESLPELARLLRAALSPASKE
jgi:GTP-binding protein